VATEERNGYVYRATLTEDALTKLVTGRFEGAGAIIRRVASAQFASFPSAEIESLPGDWTEGQIFNTEAELRWRQATGGYAVLLLTEKDDPPANFQPLAGSQLTVVCPSSDETHGFLLWGTRQTGSQRWEARIPRPLRYPGKPTVNPPKLAYQLYQEGAVVRWVRLVKLVEVT
jgi:hypothetical protein